jgi:hypothetical protein
VSAGIRDFELLVALRIQQRGADAADASGRAQMSLISALADKELFPDAHRRIGFWDGTLGARLVADDRGLQVQVLMTKEVES